MSERSPFSRRALDWKPNGFGGHALELLRAATLVAFALSCNDHGDDPGAGGSPGRAGAGTKGGAAGEAGASGEGGEPGTGGNTGGLTGEGGAAGTGGTDGEGGTSGGTDGGGGTDATGGTGGTAGEAGNGGDTATGGDSGAGGAGTSGMGGMGGTAPPSPGFVVSAPVRLDTEEQCEGLEFTLALNRAPIAPVVVNVRSTDATEGRIDGSVLGYDDERRHIQELLITFRPSDWDVPRIVPVRGVDDALCDGDQVYAIDVFRTTSEDPDFDGLDGPNIPALNLDDEPASCPEPSGDPGAVVAQLTSAFDASEIAIDGQGNMYEAVRRTEPPYAFVYSAFGGNSALVPMFDFATEDLTKLGEDSIHNDQLGFVYVAQRFVGDIELGPHSLSAGAGEALYLAKVHPSGEIMQLEQLPSPPIDPDSGTRIEAGPLGSVLLVRQDTWTLLDEDFELVWTAPAFRTDVLKARDEGAWVAVDALGQTYYWQDTVVFRIARNGASEPMIDVGSFGADEITGIASSFAGQIYVTGEFTGSLAIGTDAYESTEPQAFVASFDENGEPRWAALPTGNPRLEQVAISLRGNVYAAGRARASGELSWPQHLEKLDILGRSQWINDDWPARSSVGNGRERGLMAVHPNGDVAVLNDEFFGDLQVGTIFKFAP
jgi:hypothetical protein